MTPLLRPAVSFAVAIVMACPPVSARTDDTAALFVQYCAQCHGVDRLGLMGPALLPENLTRLKKEAAIEVVSRGRAATRPSMPPRGQR